VIESYHKRAGAVKLFAKWRRNAQKSAGMTESELIEGGRRARAAIAYAGTTVADVAGYLHVSEATAGRILAGNRKETSWDQLWAIADYCKLPRDWYSADFTRLGEITQDGAPRFGLSPDLREQMSRDLEERVAQARKRSAAAAKGKRGRRR
jgi:transcriptional regulator with XRE-family HTH domain